MKILFVYDHTYPHLWKDGLWAALNILDNKHTITRWNLAEATVLTHLDYDFILGHGAFESSVDKQLQKLPGKKGLCIAGNAFDISGQQYDVLFHETDWFKPRIENHPNIVKAFGVNTSIYKSMELPKVWDYLTVGAFALWKNQVFMTKKEGTRLAVGEIQRGNQEESFNIIGALLAHGIGVMDMVSPEKLAVLYNMSRCVYIPASVVGGGERAVLEAMACGTKVEIEYNPKLQELLDGPVYDHIHYANKLQEGIELCL